MHDEPVQLHGNHPIEYLRVGAHCVDQASQRDAEGQQKETHGQSYRLYVVGHLQRAHEEEHEVEGAVQHDGGQQDLC